MALQYLSSNENYFYKYFKQIFNILNSTVLQQTRGGSISVDQGGYSIIYYVIVTADIAPGPIYSIIN